MMHFIQKYVPKWMIYPVGGSILFFVLILLGRRLFPNIDEKIVISDIVSAVVSLTAALVLLRAAKRSITSSRALFLAWGFIALGQFATALGDLIWAVLEIQMGISPYPSIADIFYLAFYPLFLIGVFSIPRERFSRKEWIKKGLDLGIIMIASILFFWNFLIAPAAALGLHDPVLLRILGLAYPIADLLMLWGLLSLLYDRSSFEYRLPVLLLAIAMTIMIFTDSIFSAQSLAGTYESGGWLDAGWIASYVLMAHAGGFQVLASARSSQRNPANRPACLSPDRLDRFTMYVPYVWLVAAFWILIYSHVHPLSMSFEQIALGVGTIVVLVLIRQMAALTENNLLVSQLQQTMNQIQLQSNQLEKNNQILLTEISLRQRVEEKLSYDAMHDSLTGLPNRALFMDRLGQAIEYIHRSSDHLFSVLFIDLDSFKVINDSLGHFVGDEMLETIGRRLSGCLRSSDTVARLGGDEFGILLDHAGNPGGLPVITRVIQETLKQPFLIKGHEIVTTASIGIVSNLVEYTSAEEVLRDVDIAMYRAKVLGKDGIEVFSPQLHDQVFMRLALESELRHALENHEFELYYQPIFSLTTDQITGFEALIRWNHPARGLLAPNEFLPVAEETGLILQIGQWVLYDACSQLSRWRQIPGLENLTVNVNTSPRQLKQLDFVEQVINILGETGLSPRALKLEITESMVMDNPVIVNDLFQRLYHLGVQLQVDDFGTGYSSLSYLQHFSFHSIKIDRSFIQEMDRPGRKSDLVRTMVQMAHDLGMNAIAEGVETEEQLAELKRLKCQYAQGFLLSRPIQGALVESRFHVLQLLPEQQRVDIPR